MHYETFCKTESLVKYEAFYPETFCRPKVQAGTKVFGKYEAFWQLRNFLGTKLFSKYEGFWPLRNFFQQVRSFLTQGHKMFFFLSQQVRNFLLRRFLQTEPRTQFWSLRNLQSNCNQTENRGFYRAKNTNARTHGAYPHMLNFSTKLFYRQKLLLN